MQAAAILDLLDESLWTEDAVSKLKTMVAEMTAEAEGSQVKRDTQDYRMLPYYMSEKLSEQLKGKQCQENVALQALCKHAWLLGLRCPSELTLAILLCMAHYNSVSRMSDKDKYNLLLSKKPLMKKWLGVLPDPSPYLLSLPQDPQDLPAGMLSAAFPEGNVVEGPLPAAEILLLAKQMPLRVSNKAVTDPKTAAAQGSGMMNSPARAFGHMNDPGYPQSCPTAAAVSIGGRPARAAGLTGKVYGHTCGWSRTHHYGGAGSGCSDWW